MNNSFKARVSSFWKEFEAKEHTIRELMDAKAEAQELIDGMQSLLDTAFETSYFEMGINSENKYELILTPEGDRIKLPLLNYWKEKAPQQLSQTWNFYSTKPAISKGEDFQMKMYDTSVSNKDFDIYYAIDNERKKFDIEIYCDKFSKLTENQKYSFFFIFIDQVIGELYTMEFIGYIDFLDKKKKGQEIVTPSQLKDIIHTTISQNNWNVLKDSSESVTAYKMQPKEDEEENPLLRTDVFIGYSSSMQLINAYYQNETKTVDDCIQNGAIYGFLFYDNSKVPSKEMVPFRGMIEDEIMEAFSTEKDVLSLGGATGNSNSYIDFLIYDFDRFIQIAKQVAAKYELENCGFSQFKQDGEVIPF